jgi:hypothetical protein
MIFLRRSRSIGGDCGTIAQSVLKWDDYRRNECIRWQAANRTGDIENNRLATDPTLFLEALIYSPPSAIFDINIVDTNVTCVDEGNIYFHILLYCL